MLPFHAAEDNSFDELPLDRKTSRRGGIVILEIQLDNSGQVIGPIEIQAIRQRAVECHQLQK